MLGDEGSQCGRLVGRGRGRGKPRLYRVCRMLGEMSQAKKLVQVRVRVGCGGGGAVDILGNAASIRDLGHQKNIVSVAR